MKPMQDELLNLGRSDVWLDRRSDDLPAFASCMRRPTSSRRRLQLVDKHQQRAEQIADDIEPDALRRLLYFLVDTVLERPELPSPAVVSLGVTAPTVAESKPTKRDVNPKRKVRTGI